MLNAGLVVAAIVALVALVSTALVFRTYAVVPRISDIAPGPAGEGPRVSIVVAARNESTHIRQAVASLLSQDYHDIELIVVEDRSTDRTGALLDEMAAKTERLKIVHVKELPSGWLGKNHALHVGAARATGEALLFIDGDIILERTVLSRAVAVLQLGADHVTIGPHMELPSRLLQAVVAYFLTWGVIALRLWQVNDPKSRAFVGVGAFNLVTTKWYNEIGGHTRIRMRPDDDLMLGKVLKHSGARQRVLFGRDMVGVEWYTSLDDARRGFRKNAFSSLQYSVPLFLAGMLSSVVNSIWPFVAVWTTTGTTQLLYVAAVAAMLVGFVKTAREQRMPAWLALLYPVAALLQLWMLCDAVGRTIIAGGIDWRGTFYSLAELKANKV